jgi:hypothetical protein
VDLDRTRKEAADNIILGGRHVPAGHRPLFDECAAGVADLPHLAEMGLERLHRGSGETVLKLSELVDLLIIPPHAAAALVDDVALGLALAENLKLQFDRPLGKVVKLADRILAISEFRFRPIRCKTPRHTWPKYRHSHAAGRPTVTRAGASVLSLEGEPGHQKCHFLGEMGKLR